MANEIESGQELNATQLDAQRAKNLLDRALGMSEGNDIVGAIIACRQSLALAPKSPQGWSMLGLLSERDGNIDGAIEAYEKALALSPGSMLERESLQRLRQQHGSAPRPAPKFNFNDSVKQVPPTPPTLTEQEPPALPKEIQLDPLPEPFLSRFSGELWNTFYFRSLPLLVATVVCMGFILVAQRVAANYQKVNTVNSVQDVPATSAIGGTDDSTVSPQPASTDPQNLPPNALAPPVQPDQPVSSEVPAATAEAPTPVAPSKPALASKPKFSSRPQVKLTAKTPPPSAMPVLPAPRLTLPQSRATTPPQSDTADNSSTDNTTDGGPVDVGSSESDKYIPINPPHFPNPRRNR
ncbi:MAG: tetratricopeptide repeat protein [Abditibacteriaceae bacterium]